MSTMRLDRKAALAPINTAGWKPVDTRVSTEH